MMDSDDIKLPAGEVLQNLFVMWFGFRKFRRELEDYVLHESCDLDHLWRNLWFSKTPETDHLVRSRFGGHIPLLTEYEPINDLELVGMVIMYDQLPRNVFRGSSNAYVYDHIARRHARKLMPRFDSLPVYIQICLILVLVHSEDMSDQAEAGRLQKSIAAVNDTNPIVTKTLARITQVHHDHVSLFGRLPQRQLLNEAPQLTSEERVFLSNIG